MKNVLKRIETGETTVGDKYEVEDYIKRRSLIAFALGVMFCLILGTVASFLPL